MFSPSITKFIFTTKTNGILVYGKFSTARNETLHRLPDS